MSRLRVTPQALLAAGALLAIAAVFLHVSPKNPPGFYRDESAIAYNAYTLETTGKDEYGGRFPLFIKSFGDYKSPLYVYLLSAAFRVTGPSTSAARTLSAVLGLAAILLLFVLARSISRSTAVAVAVALLAGLSPWLFEISRLVFEVALEPLLIVSFLVVLYRAYSRTWRLPQSLGMGALLAAMVYTYQAGRVFGPLLALGLLFFRGRAGGRQLCVVASTFVVLLVPIAVYVFVHPGALQERYDSVTWIHSQAWWDVARLFLVHWAENMNPWKWLVQGDQVERHHVPGDGSLFWVQVGLAIAGAVIVILRRRSDPWWRFVLWGVIISPVAAALTIGSIMSLRMITLPVFLSLLAIPALQALGGIRRRGVRIAAVGAVAALFAVEAVNWQYVFAHDGPDRGFVFEADVRPIVEAALAHGGTAYARRDNHTAYIDTLFYAAAAGRKPKSIVVLEPGVSPPPGVVFVGGAGDCPQCRQLAVDANYGAFVTPS